MDTRQHTHTHTRPHNRQGRTQRNRKDKATKKKKEKAKEECKDMYMGHTPRGSGRSRAPGQPTRGRGEGNQDRTYPGDDGVEDKVCLGHQLLQHLHRLVIRLRLAEALMHHWHLNGSHTDHLSCPSYSPSFSFSHHSSASEKLLTHQ